MPIFCCQGFVHQMCMLGSLAGWLTMFLWLCSFLLAACGRIPQDDKNASLGVRLRTLDRHHILLDNALVQVTLSSPAGDITGIEYNGVENILEIRNGEGNRGYWDVVWNKPGHRIAYDKLRAKSFSVVREDEDQVEVSFTRKWDFSLENSTVPLNVDKRYILRRGSSGIYMYAILERLKGWPDVDMDQIRTVLKLQRALFHSMVVSDNGQKIMPSPEDRTKGQRLDYAEAVRLTNPSNPGLRGEVDDKYQYSYESKENRVHGWISNDPPVGFWMITPSDEFRAGGPIKQDLTSHAGPTVLSMYTSTHYTGKDLNTAYRDGIPWKKVIGPVFVYLNSISTKNDPLITLWENAKQQMLREVRSWPYDFLQSEDFPSLNQRGSVAGQILVRDKYINQRLMRANYAYVGLAAPGDVGSWQREAKGYQFWTRANGEGYFLIENVRAGNYNLYAWVPGIIGDYKYHTQVTIEPGREIKLGALVYEPPRNGPTIWEIGIPDRRPAEFYVPEASPGLVNKLYASHPTDKFRQYGLWDRYTDLYPNHDLVYTIGTSDYRRDWFFAHVPRKSNETYGPTTWQIVFDLKNMKQTGKYTLQLALASANAAELQVRLNNPSANPPQFSTGLIGRDNAIARHGNHGLYWLYSIQVPGHLLLKRRNTIYLTQSRSSGPFRGIMYDYIRFEGPPETLSMTE